MRDVYELCPILENERFLLRLLKEEDTDDLLKVYSDEKAVPYFNGDNCHGDNFYYSNYERMKEAMKFWLMSYDNHWFVRFTIVDKKSKEAIGTVEVCNRNSDDYYNECGIIRVDLRSDYENKESIKSVLEVIVPEAYKLFNCTRVVTKAWQYAEERIEALKSCGFVRSEEPLVGDDGTRYGDYWIASNK